MNRRVSILAAIALLVGAGVRTLAGETEPAPTGDVASTTGVGSEDDADNADNADHAENVVTVEGSPGPLLGPTLTGGWFGADRWLRDHGLTIELVYTGEVMGNVAGGIKKGATYLDNWDLVFTAETEPLIGLPGGTVLVYVLANTGGEPSLELIGDLQVASNIETNLQGVQFYEVWYNQAFLDDRLSLRFGLYDLNSEFDVNDVGAIFLNSSHGIGVDFAQSGKNGPSIFPITSLALRGDWRISDELTWRAAALDGAPEANLDSLHRPLSDLGAADGALLVTELDFRSFLATRAYRLAAGMWGYTAQFGEVRNPDVDSAGNIGAYGIVEMTAYEETKDQGLSAFLRFGAANPTYNVFGFYVGTGVVYTGLIPTRDADQLGLAMATAITGHDLQRAAAAAGSPVHGAEINFELTYRAEVLPWLVLQPDLQYIIHPGIDRSLDNALALALRLEVTF